MSALIEFPIQAEKSTGQFDSGFEDMPPVMSPKTLGQFLEVTPTTLTRWRQSQIGPAYFTPTGTNLVRYSRRDVLAWLHQEMVEPSKTKKPAGATAGQNTNLKEKQCSMSTIALSALSASSSSLRTSRSSL